MSEGAMYGIGQDEQFQPVAESTEILDVDLFLAPEHMQFRHQSITATA